MKYLVGVDGSSCSFVAAALVGKLAAAGKDQIALYYSPTEIPLSSGGDEGPQMHERARAALAEAVFAEAARHLPEPLQAGTHKIVGSQRPGHGMVLAANQWRADLIAVGARGLGPIEGLLLGSVSTTVVQTATIPVLVVRPNQQVKAAGLRLMLCYDETNFDRQSELLRAIQWPAGTVGSVIRVVGAMNAGPVPDWLEQRARDADAEAMANAWVQEHQQDVLAARNELATYQKTLPPPFQKSPPRVAEGHPAEQILKAIREESTDIVIVGKTSSGGLIRWLLGSTSEKILSQAPCSVMVIPGQERP